MPSLSILPEALQTLVMNCLRDAPREAVGLLGAQLERVGSRCDPLHNVAPHDGFAVLPTEHYEAELRLLNEGFSVLANYHSHPNGCAHPSALDRLLLSRRPEASLIVAFQLPFDGLLAVRAYQGSAFSEIDITAEGMDVVLAEGCCARKIRLPPDWFPRISAPMAGFTPAE